jgi:hypothetical protein
MAKVNRAKACKRKSSRMKIVDVITTKTKGRFFTVTFTKKNGEERTINCNCKKNAQNNLGYITVYSPNEKGYKNINAQTIKSVVFQNTVYSVK